MHGKICILYRSESANVNVCCCCFVLPSPYDFSASSTWVKCAPSQHHTTTQQNALCTLNTGFCRARNALCCRMPCHAGCRCYCIKCAHNRNEILPRAGGCSSRVLLRSYFAMGIFSVASRLARNARNVGHARLARMRNRLKAMKKMKTKNRILTTIPPSPLPHHRHPIHWQANERERERF